MKRWLCVVLFVACTPPKQGRVGRVLHADPSDISDTPGLADTQDVADTPETATPLHVCGHQSATVAGVVDVSVLLVMDRSRSMQQGSKWPQTRTAVEAALSLYDRYMRFGLLMYPSGEDVCDVVDAELDVPISLENSGVINDVMADAELLRGTPTGAALRTARDVLEHDPGEHRVVILATDGAPDCTIDGWDNGSGLAASEAYDATNDLAEGGVPVYVVGIQGSSSARAVLNRIADIGGTAKPGDTAFYETSSGAELAQALVDIALDLDGCAFELDAHDDAVEMHVARDGRGLPAGASDGWEVHDGRLRLNGLACLATPGEAHEVEVTWYCE